MNTTNKRLSAIGAGLVIATLLVSCARGSEEVDTSPSGATMLDVGVIEDQTGTAATAGQSNVCGIKVANDALTAGDLPGAPVQLHIEDSQTTPAVAAQAASKLTGEGIVFFAGGTGTNTLLSQIPIINEVKGLTTGGVTKATQVLAEADNGFRLNGDTSHDSRTVATHLEDIDAQTVAFIVEEGAFGESAAAAISDLLPANIQVVDEVVVPLGETDFTSAVTRVKSQAADAVVWALSGTAGPVAVIRELRQQDVQSTVVPGAGLLSGTVAEAAGPAADGIVGFEVWSPTTDNVANEAFKEHFEKYAGEHAECSDKTLDKQIALSYSQLALLAAAIDKSGSTDPATVRKAVVEGSWELPQGTVTFDSTGQAQVEYTQYVAKGGLLVSEN